MYCLQANNSGRSQSSILLPALSAVCWQSGLVIGLVNLVCAPVGVLSSKQKLQHVNVLTAYLHYPLIARQMKRTLIYRMMCCYPNLLMKQRCGGNIDWTV